MRWQNHLVFFAQTDRPTPPVAPTQPGLDVNRRGDGVFAVAAPRATSVELCVRRGNAEHRQRLRYFDAGLHWDTVHGMVPGTQYGLRVEGEWAPEQGLFYNPAKLLTDPYAHGVSHYSPPRPEMFPRLTDNMLHPVSTDRCDRDSAGVAVWSEVTDDDFDWQGDAPLRTDWSRTSIYELHVKGFTALHPEIPEELRGTYAGLAHPAAISYLRSLGITAVELLPIHAAMDEPHLTQLGLSNYWGYSTLSFFSPHAAYATTSAQRGGASAVLREVKTMVKALHAAGIEVILDVVYNHTAEGGADGPLVGLRGIDNLEYYWFDNGHYTDVTGTGSTLNSRSVHVMDLVLSSLRYWAEDVHIDGFRFDLASAIARDDRGFRADHPLLRAIATDPVLRTRKLIAEPWDVGAFGWQTGSFPPPFAEWNDRFRNDLRSFWIAQPGERDRTGNNAVGGIRRIATRLAGSSDLMKGHHPHGRAHALADRSPWASINFVTAHDGFTLADLTAYDHKHNEANGEHNRDGSSDNSSWNHGHEGPVDLSSAHGQAIDARRRRTQRAALASLVLASGTPMITAGDERGRSQGGNNNAYCQDNELSWMDWSDLGRHESSVQTLQSALALRTRYPQLRAPHFLRPADPESLDIGQVGWFGAEGSELSSEQWDQRGRHVLQMLRPGLPHQEHLLIVVNSSAERTSITLPHAPWPQGPARLILNSANDDDRPADRAEADQYTGRPDSASPTADDQAYAIADDQWSIPGTSVVVLGLPSAFAPR